MNRSLISGWSLLVILAGAAFGDSERRCGHSPSGAVWVNLNGADGCPPMGSADCNTTGGDYAYNPDPDDETYIMLMVTDFSLDNYCRVGRVVVRFLLRYDYDCDGQSRRVMLRVRVPSAGIDQHIESGTFSQANNDGDCHWVVPAQWDITHLTSWDRNKLNDLRIGLAPVRRANEPCGGSTSWLRTRGGDVLVDYERFRAPTIHDIPDHAAPCGSSYAGPVPMLSDAGCMAPVTWSLIQGPVGATINPATGQVSWNPTVYGWHPVTIRAANAQGFHDESWALSVAQDRALIAPISELTAICGSSYTSPPPVIQNAACAGVVTWVLGQGPIGMTINPQTGAVSWPNPLPGRHAVTIQARNGAGNADEPWTLAVAELVPEIAAISNAPIAQRRPYPGPIPSLVNAQCAGQVSWSLVQGPSGMTIDTATGAVHWPLPLPGTHGVVIRAANSAGSDTEDWQLMVESQCPIRGCDDPTADSDIDDDCDVDIDDLTLLLAAFGGPTGPADIDRDGAVGLADLALLLSRFGLVCY